MKQFWQKLSARIDAMSLRERVLIFIMSVAILLVLVNVLLLDPQFAKQKQLSQRVIAEQAQIAVIQSDIQQKVRARTNDPDTATRQRLTHLKRQSEQLRGALQETQKALVTPEKMPALLEAILKRDGRLQLVSLKTLPVSSLSEPVSNEAKPARQSTVATDSGAAAASLKAGSDTGGIGIVYRHGVEITVAGSYSDMMRYMAELEAMPWQLYWGKARFQVESYPRASLTLTVFTLSLDKKWMNL